MSAFGTMHVEKSAHFAQDALERAGLQAARAFHHIAVHRIAGPDDLVPFPLHRAHQWCQSCGHLVMPKAADQRDPPRFTLRVHHVEQTDQRIRLQAGAAFHADGIGQPAHELDMGRAFEPRAIADPQEMRAGVVILLAGRAGPRQCLLIGQQQRLMAGVERGRLQLRQALRVDPASSHERQRLVYPVGHILIGLGPFALPHEIQRPLMDLAEIGEATAGEGAQQIERGGGLAVGAQHALRIGLTRAGLEIDVVDDIAAIAGQFFCALHFGRRGTRLGELPCHAAHLHHRKLAGIGQHHRHLQDDAKAVADIVRMKFGEALGAVAALQKEALPRLHLGQFGLQRVDFAGEHQRRIAAERLLHRLQRGSIAIIGHLNAFMRAPALRGPIGRHVSHPSIPATAPVSAMPYNIGAHA